jgi:carbonic anhydrase
MYLDGIVERNRRYVLERAASPLPPPTAVRTVVISCYDPPLEGLLAPALGLGAGEAIILKTAGGAVTPGGDPLHSLAMALFLFGATEVVVVGHTGCRMAGFEASPFIDAFRRRGVPREAFGPQDLRAWAGAVPDARRGVEASVAAVLQAPFLPRDVAVSGLLLDDATGALEVVCRPGETVAAGAQPEPAQSTAPVDGPPADSPAPPPAAARAVATGDAAPSPAVVDRLGTDLGGAVSAVRSFVRALEARTAWRDALAGLRQDLARERNPLLQVALVEGFMKRATADSREVAAAFQSLKREVVSGRSSFAWEDLVQIFRRRAG